VKESNIQREIMLALSNLGCKLFRINVGTGWTGKKQTVNKTQLITMYPGDVLLREARPLRTGVPKGYHDLSGWTPVEVTGDMVGKTLAVFTSIEVKTPTGRIRPEQKTFQEAVVKDGGISTIARSTDDAEAAIIQVVNP
jgi:hypothetical protein